MMDTIFINQNQKLEIHFVVDLLEDVYNQHFDEEIKFNC